MQRRRRSHLAARGTRTQSACIGLGRNWPPRSGGGWLPQICLTVPQIRVVANITILWQSKTEEATMLSDDDRIREDLDLALAEVDPARNLGYGLDPDSPQGRETFAALLAEIEGDEAPGPGRTQPIRRRRLVAGVAVVVAASAAALLLVGLNTDEGSVGVTPAQAALQKLSLAAGAANQHETPLREGDYYYRRVVGYGVGESWIGVDGSGAYRNNHLDDNRLHRIDADLGAISVGADDQISYGEFLDLPRDPNRLYDYFATRAGLETPPGVSEFEAEQIRGENVSTPPNQRMFFTIESIFVQVPIPPDLRVALFHVLERIDGIRLLGMVRNEAGEQGIGIGMYRGVTGPDDPTPQSRRWCSGHHPRGLTFNPDKGDVIGYRSGNPAHRRARPSLRRHRPGTRRTSVAPFHVRVGPRARDATLIPRRDWAGNPG